MLTRTLDGRGREVRARYSGAASDLTGVDSSYGIVDEPLAKVEQRASGTVTEAYGYDGEADRRLVTSIRRGTQLVAYGYSPSGRRSSVTTAGGQVEYEYDDAYDRLARIRRNTEVGTAITWEPGGERITELLGGGLRECRTYWGQGWLKQLSSVDAGASCESPTPHERYVYHYDGRGNRTSEERTVGAVTRTLGYGYDDADRLTGVQYEDGSAALYQIGSDGSRTGEKQVDAYAGPLGPEGYAGALGVVEKTYRYDARGGLADILDGGSTLVHYAVDDAGRVLSEQRAGLVRQYGWDASGRLSSIQVSQTAGGAVDTTTYRYDHAGHRIEKHGPSGDQAYIWGGSELHEETTASGARMVYERAGDLVVAVNGERVLHDGLGSVTGRLSASGTFANLRYDAWGGFRSGTSGPGASEPSLAYAGQHWDADAGLSYAQQRWYDPGTGRFLSEDPLGPSGERLRQPGRLLAFGYAAGNPLTYTDPLGLDASQAEKSEREYKRVKVVEAWNKTNANKAPGERPRIRDQYTNEYPADTKEELEAWCRSGKDPGACTELGYHELAAGTLTAIVAIPVALGTAPVWMPLATGYGVYKLPEALPAIGDDAVDCVGAEGQTPERVRACINTATVAATTFLGGVGASSAGPAITLDLQSAPKRVPNGAKLGAATNAAAKAEAPPPSPPPAESPSQQYLYRGVHAEHPALDEAKRGRVVPGNPNGTMTPEQHQAGAFEGFSSADSPFTSWTHEPGVAARFATERGPGGVVLRVPLGPPPEGATWRWEPFLGDDFFESERLLRGVREGAEVLKPEDVVRGVSVESPHPAK
jgi:RHS repeat-associated protein